MAHKQHWENLMVFYGEAHQNTINVLTHVIGVPIIICSVFAAISLIPIGPLETSWLLVAGLSLYYLYLDLVFGVSIIPLLVGLNLIAQYAVQQFSQTDILIWSAAGFFGGYILQFVGHAIEGKKPSLVQNPVMAMVVAPLFMVAELYKLLGLRSELNEAVEKRLKNS